MGLWGCAGSAGDLRFSCRDASWGRASMQPQPCAPRRRRCTRGRAAEGGSRPPGCASAPTPAAERGEGETPRPDGGRERGSLPPTWWSGGAAAAAPTPLPSLPVIPGSFPRKMCILFCFVLDFLQAFGRLMLSTRDAAPWAPRGKRSPDVVPTRHPNPKPHTPKPGSFPAFPVTRSGSLPMPLCFGHGRPSSPALRGEVGSGTPVTITTGVEGKARSFSPPCLLRALDSTLLPSFSLFPSHSPFPLAFARLFHTAKGEGKSV